jgi:hypothetical protein
MSRIELFDPESFAAKSGGREVVNESLALPQSFHNSSAEEPGAHHRDTLSLLQGLLHSLHTSNPVE